MDAYPLDLILAVATASATIFLGFLPTKTISSAFIARETLKASAAWVIVAFLCPLEILHYPLILAILCLCAWWQFGGNHALNGKLWLSVASGLGISVGVLFVLAVTPFAYPPYFPILNGAVLLASIYLGGTVIGLAYFCFALVRGAGVAQGIIQRHAGLLLVLVLIRAAVLLGELLQSPSPYNDRFISLNGRWNNGPSTNLSTSTLHVGPFLFLPMALLIILCFLAKRASGFSSRMQPTRFLVGIMVVGFLTEILARLLVL